VKGIWIGFISPGWASGRGSPDCRVTCVHHDHDHQQPENMRDIRWTYGSRDSGHVANCQRSKGVEKVKGRDQRFHAGGIGREKTNRMFKRKMRTAAAERSTWPLQKGVALEGRTTETWAWSVEFEGSGFVISWERMVGILRARGWAHRVCCIFNLPSYGTSTPSRNTFALTTSSASASACRETQS